MPRTELSFYIRPLALTLCCVALGWAWLRTSQSIITQGDFPAFYSAAKILASDTPSSLYNEQAQAEIQNTFWPDLQGAFSSFAYPPYFAAALSPLAVLDPLPAQLLWLLLQSGFFLCGMALLSRARVTPFTFLDLAALNILFLPTFIGIFGGQTLGLSLCLFSALIYAIAKERFFLAGVVAGLALFKPQYGIIFSCAALIVGGASAGLALLLTAAFLGAVTYIGAGANAVGVWIDAAQNFAIKDYAANAQQMVSFPSFLGGSFFAQCLGACAALLYFLFLFLRRHEWEGRVHGILLLGPIAVLFSPQASFYDLGLAFLPLTLIAPRWLAIVYLIAAASVAYARESLWIIGTGLAAFLLCAAIIYARKASTSISTSAPFGSPAT